MKKIILSLLFAIPYISGRCQQTSLSENFNSGCPSGYSNPNSWMTYNKFASTYPDGAWHCDPMGGRSGSTGMVCTGLYGTPLASYHLDTSVLVSPPLDLHGYSVPIYVNFDTKTTSISLGAKIEVLLSRDSTMDADSAAVVDTFTVYKLSSGSSSSMTPVFGPGDETDWVTHQVDLTPYKHIYPMYLGFRYTSETGTTGCKWFLDNINTTTTPFTSVVTVPAASAIGCSANMNGTTMTISCQAFTAGNYKVAVYDMAGRSVLNTDLHVPAGRSYNNIPGCSFAPGMYIVHIGNEHAKAATKLVVY